MPATRRSLPTLVAGLLAVAVGAAPALADTAHEPAVPAGSRVAPARAPGSSVAAALSPTRIGQSLGATANRSRYLGPHLSGLVTDAGTGSVVWSYRAGQSRMPASTQKLLTAHTVLHSMNPATTFTTSAVLSPGGSVFLRGQGDPSLDRYRLGVLANRATGWLKARHRTSVNVYYDTGWFPLQPTAAYGWSKGTLDEDTQLVRGLALAGYRGRGDSARAAATVFARGLTARGIHAVVRHRSTTPAAGRSLATTTSAPVRSLVADMLNASDNDYAEFLLQQAARARHYPAGRYAALMNQRRLLTADGVPTAGLLAYDGSGLSHADRMPPVTLSTVIRRLADDPATAAVVFAPGAVPRAGQSGTLYNRFHDPISSCAAGRVTAKTGTLADAVTLAGIASGVDGRRRIFVLLQNGATDTHNTRLAVDHLAAIVVGCHA